MLDLALTHLRSLVSFDTTNPPRRIDADDGVVGYVAGVLAGAGMDVHVENLGDGCINVFAARGESDLLLQCHLDTVPADPAWEGDPHTLTLRDNVALGLGACDVKGSAACVLSALEHSDAPANVLFTTDEEAGSGTCVRSFLEQVELAVRPRPRVVLVCEPTECRAVTAHRGIGVAEIGFTGTAAHTSHEGATECSAIHRSMAWGSLAIAAASDGALSDCRFNIGVVSGGVKANMAAPSASVIFGVRPHGGRDPERILDTAVGLAPAEWIGSRRVRFVAPGLVGRAEAMSFIEACALEHAGSVDFWTEAALFGASAIPAIVLGPGSIRQAHAAGEFVAMDQLERAVELFTRCISVAARQQGAPA